MKRFAFLLAFSCLLLSDLRSQPAGTDSVNQDGAFTRVDVEASFVGGLSAWRKFLEKNLNANVPVDNGAPAGRYTIIVQFVVDKDGSVTDVKALTKEGYGMEAEVLRLMRVAGKWSPAMVGERPVKAYRKQPVIFAVEDDALEVVTKVPYVLFTDTDNEVRIAVDGVKDKDLDVSISSGTIERTGENNFNAIVKKTGRVIVTVSHLKKKKTLGQISFEVKKNG